MVELVSGEGAHELGEERGEHLDGVSALGVFGDGAPVVGHGPCVVLTAHVEGLGRVVAVGVGAGPLLDEPPPPVGVQEAEYLPMCQTTYRGWGGVYPPSAVRAGRVAEIWL